MGAQPPPTRRVAQSLMKLKHSLESDREVIHAFKAGIGSANKI
jgi:hypothetical protein